MKKKDWLFIIGLFFIWRVLVFIIAFLATKYIPLQENFLGGGLGSYLKAPLFWAWSNFDGEHYLSIAQNGYGWGEQAFFPLFPLLIRLIGRLLGGSLISYNIVGLFISNISFLISMFGLYKLVRIDYSEKVAKVALILLLIYPASFYFGATYTESLFFALVIWSFYFFRKGNYLAASFLGMFASATRTIGFVLLPIYLIELLKINSFSLKKFKAKYLVFFLIPLGLIAYMYYLYISSGDPFLFGHVLPGFGEQRSSIPIILPQVFYRYFVKILPNLNYSYFPVVFTTLMEIFVALIFLGLGVMSFFRLNLGYSLFFAFAYLMPTLSGSFSSLPRYVVVLFPAYILLSLMLAKASKTWKFIVFALLFLLLVISEAFFVRGFWIS